MRADLAQRRARLGEPGDGTVQVAIEYSQLAVDPQRARQSPALAQRPEPGQRLRPGGAHPRDVAIVFVEGRGYHPGRGGEPLVPAGLGLLEELADLVLVVGE